MTNDLAQQAHQVASAATNVKYMLSAFQARSRDHIQERCAAPSEEDEIGDEVVKARRGRWGAYD